MMFKKPKLNPTDKLYADVRMYDIRQLYFLHSITHYHKFVNSDQKIKQSLYKRKVKFPASIMVWGSMSSKGVGKLHFVDENMDTNKYLAILEESLLPVMEECLTSGQDFMFQQDGAACHTSKKAIKWMEENNVPLLKWVSSSSDLSPIKTLWHEMKKRQVKFPASIMVWGSMSSKGVGKLHFIDGNVDTNKYLAILDESLLPVMEECLTSGQDFVFQQDGAACHTSKKAIKWMEENNVPLLKWVSSSPDLSPIETLTLRIIIYYFQRQLSQQEYLAELLSVFGNEAPHQSTISRWYREFKRGRENVDAVRKLIIENRHVPYREIEASLKISKTSIQKILHESPNDFFTFPKIKNRLRGQRFQSPEEAWNKCFENWFECMQMCITLRGEYFEKQ
ncbi:unnamed protein product [Acanthoscelides obtectus]|uniref:Mos1 transposase HTH domain-containing protein n=1 Tax=Acanthoscelides obtectus TaxID=200917 RepID=A0A9P0MAW6_ACAOB|nr:unnamed protein product [Acanthoscelides obtectus]CAK1631808.1 Transposable element Tc1 transposase [Acanthoscelides obtectus]